MHRLLVLGLLASCTNHAPGESPERAHDPRFHGWWVVEQPTHALYEATYYELRADGTLVTGASTPADCGGHLARHCVTGSVARCVPEAPATRCEAELTCVFGDSWSSLDAAHLVIAGACSDGRARDIVIAMNPDPSSNAEWGGAGGELVSVDGEPGWSHDNWAWAFRKCASGSPDC